MSTKKFGNFVALDDVSLDVPDGSLLALLGPSGSGKTTLLRIIAGLEGADRGSVLYHDEDVTHRSPRDRNVGFVFQHYALFRHMTVFENVAFGLRVRRAPKSQVDARVRELLHLVRLDGFGGRYPPQLSGGQRQRVALARALAVEPGVLLLDEPFGALDAKVRQELRQWLRRFHDEIKVTTIFVTHDQEEAFEVADRVVVMHNGRIEQHGTPQEVFDHPANPFVMDFLGNVNVFHGRVQDGKMLLGRASRWRVPNTRTANRGRRRPTSAPTSSTSIASPPTPRACGPRCCRSIPTARSPRCGSNPRNRHLELNVEINLDRYAELGLQAGRPGPRRPAPVPRLLPGGLCDLTAAHCGRTSALAGSAWRRATTVANRKRLPFPKPTAPPSVLLPFLECSTPAKKPTAEPSAWEAGESLFGRVESPRVAIWPAISRSRQRADRRGYPSLLPTGVESGPASESWRNRERGWSALYARPPQSMAAWLAVSTAVIAANVLARTVRSRAAAGSGK